MIRYQAVSITSKILSNYHFISANGFISRDLYENNEKPSNFYMIGSMGLASSIALGVALKNPKKKICIFDGDGNILMNLGSLTTIGTISPKNLIHIVFDNSAHESTGGQPTNTKKIKIDAIAKAANYKIFRTDTKKGLERILEKVKKINGPILVLIKVKKSDYISKRVDIEPIEIKKRFMKSLRK
jgi:sulfopyruvate decarboxylase subunit beta